MRQLCWLLPWWKAHQATHSLHVLVAYRGEEVCGILPLAETYQALTGRSLVFVGSGKVCSDDLGILLDESNTKACDHEEIIEAFANWLVQSPNCCRWDHLDLDGVRESNPSMEVFRECLESLTSLQVNRKPSPNCWAVSLDPDFGSYLSKLTKRARKIVREAEAAIDSGIGIFEIAESYEQALEFANEIEQMHQNRWKQQGVEGCFSSPPFRSFLYSTIQSVWQTPWRAEESLVHSTSPHNNQRLFVSRLRIDGMTVAGSIGFHDRNAIAVYLTGMNVDFAEQRPGWMLNTCIIKHAIQVGCAKLDFLRGDEEYKERLGGTPSLQRRWIVPANRLSSQVRNKAYQAAVSVKNWLKSTPCVEVN